jgi:glucose/arabinose dehydrogenase
MKNYHFFNLVIAVLLLTACNNNEKDPSPSTENPIDSPINLKRELVLSGLQNPWGIAFMNENDALITQKNGQIALVDISNGTQSTIFQVPNAVVQGQGGLLGIALSPNFESDNLVFVTYTKQNGNEFTTALGSMLFQSNLLSNFQELYVADAWGTSGVHFGSRIVFDQNGYLYFSVGDRGVMNEAQNKTNDKGAVLRLNRDGSIPADNPFNGDPAKSAALFSVGNRNIQGMTLHPVTGEIWSHEHGPQGGDEINIIKSGENYGWPLVTFGEQYGGGVISNDTTAPGMKDPLHHWTPSIAPSGMAIIHGDKYPGWEGNIITGALAGMHLNRAIFSGTNYVGETRYFEGEGRIRDVVLSPDGYLYMLNESEGALYKVIPEF